MAPLLPLGRWLIAAALLLATLLNGWPVEAREPFLANYAAALTQAQREGRLLLVLHLSGDFSAPDVPADEGKAYQALALNDERVQELLRSRFVVTYCHVGDPASLNLVAVRGKLKPAEPDSPHAIAYICLPDERVIHFVPGFVTAERLLAELAWAENCYFDFIRFPESEQAVAARQLHLAALATDAEPFAKAVRTRWLLSAPVRDDDAEHLAAVIKGARHVRMGRLDERFAGPENALLARPFYDALADHASISSSPAHMILSEYPLVPLQELAPPLYNLWTRDHFWALGPRREELKNWFLARHGKGKPLLLAVTGDSRPMDEPEPRQRFPWPPPDSPDIPLKEFEVLELSLDELVVLTADAGLPALAAQPTDLPRFVLYDRAGRRRAVLVFSDGIAKLRTMMRTCAQPGVAAASAAEKRRKDK